MLQASSEHPLARAIVNYAYHFHFFNMPSQVNKLENIGQEAKYAGSFLDAVDFTAVPGRGVKCTVKAKNILVSFMV